MRVKIVGFRGQLDLRVRIECRDHGRHWGCWSCSITWPALLDVGAGRGPRTAHHVSWFAEHLIPHTGPAEDRPLRVENTRAAVT